MTARSGHPPTSSHSRSTPQLRCAVYTRKSSEEGLDQAFNSLDAQREAGIDYIRSQKHSGWTAIKAGYDDGGYSGGTTERPGLQRLLEDIKKGRVDVVVVYKVDRLSRSLADFAQLMQLFDEHNVSFVSVTQQFNTTTSMGRLTLNMLLSFAQFEREVAGERIRDKIAATKRKGVWVCGQPPLGYRMPREGDPGFTPGDRTLRIVESEAALVRAIFEGYLELGSPVQLAQRLNVAGHTTRLWTSSRGRIHGGRPLTAGYLHRVLTNPIYIGKITHTRGRNKRAGAAQETEVHDGQHEPIIDQAAWDQVQSAIRKQERSARTSWTHTHLLKGKLRTFEGQAMSPGSVQRPISKRAEAVNGNGRAGKRLVRYYVSQKAIKHGYKACPIKTINAQHIDDLVRGLVLDHLRTHHEIDLRRHEPATRDHWIREVVHRVMLATDRLTIELARDGILVCADEARECAGSNGAGVSTGSPATNAIASPSCPFTPQVNDGCQHIVLTLAIQITRHDGRRIVLTAEGSDVLTAVTPDGRPVPTEHLIGALGLAFAWRRELLRTGCCIESIAQLAGVTEPHVRSLLALTRLGPPILRLVLTGALGPSVTLADLLKAAAHPTWLYQKRAAGI